MSYSSKLYFYDNDKAKLPDQNYFQSPSLVSFGPDPSKNREFSNNTPQFQTPFRPDDKKIEYSQKIEPDSNKKLPTTQTISQNQNDPYQSQYYSNNYLNKESDPYQRPFTSSESQIKTSQVINQYNQNPKDLNSFKEPNNIGTNQNSYQRQFDPNESYQNQFVPTDQNIKTSEIISRLTEKTKQSLHNNNSSRSLNQKQLTTSEIPAKSSNILVQSSYIPKNESVLRAPSSKEEISRISNKVGISSKIAMFDKDPLEMKDIKDYEERITFLLREIENLKVYIGKLEAENQKYSKAQEITEEFERQIKSLIDEKETLESSFHKLESLKSELEMRISTLETDQISTGRLVKDLKRNLELKIKENSDLLNKLSFFDDFKHEKERYEQKIKDQQLKIESLVQEMREMSESVQKKGFDLEVCKNTVMEFEDLNRYVARLQSEVKDWSIKEGLWKKEDEKNKLIIQELQEKIQKLQQQPTYQRDLDDYKKKTIDLENKLVMLSTEMIRLQTENQRLKDLLISEREKAQEALKRIIREKDAEMMRLLMEKDQRILELSNELEENRNRHEKIKRGMMDIQSKDEKISELERKISLLSNEIKELKDNINGKDQENRELMRKLQERDYENKALQFRLAGNEDEIKRLSQLLQEKEDQINDFRQKLRESGRGSAFLESLQLEIKGLTQKNIELFEQIETLKDLLNKERIKGQDLEAKMKRYYELESMCENLKQALQGNEGKGFEISKQLEITLDKLRSLETTNADLRKELDRVVKERNRYLEENGILIEKMHELEDTSENYQRILSKTKETMENMHERITQYEAVIMGIPELQAQIDEKTQNINALSFELESLRKLKPVLEELERDNALLKEENENLEYLINQERENCENLMKETSEKLKKYEMKNKDLEERLGGMRQENEKLKSQVNELLSMLKEYEMGHDKEKDYTMKLDASLAEINALNQVIDKKDQEIAALHESLDALSQENENLKEQMEELLKRIKALEEEIELYQSDLKKVRLDGSGQEIRMKDYEAKLNSLLKEIQNLNGLVLKRNEEIDTWRTKYAQLELQINEIRLKDTYLLDLEKKRNNLEFENESLRKTINEGSKSIFRFDETPFKVKIDELTSRTTEMNQEIKALNLELEKKDREIGLRNAEIMHYKNENSRNLYISEGGIQRDTSNYKEAIKNLEMMLQKEVKEKEKLTGKLGILEKTSQEMVLKEERIMALENRNQLLMREIEEWKRRHESFQRSIEREIDSKRY